MLLLYIASLNPAFQRLQTLCISMISIGSSIQISALPRLVDPLSEFWTIFLLQEVIGALDTTPVGRNSMISGRGAPCFSSCRV
jgi:hypothetical protein